MDIKTGRVTGRVTGKNRDGVDTVRLLQVVISDKNDVQTVQLASQSGEESNPPNGSLVVIGQAGPALKISLSTLDRVAPVVDPGGKRIYSTDSSGQSVKASIQLDPDGTITVDNPGATITITPAGLVTIDADGNTVINSNKTIINNDVDIDGDLDVTGTISGNAVTSSTTVSASGDLESAGTSFNGHTHPENDGGNTGPPN